MAGISPRDIIRHGYLIGAPVKAIAELCGSTPGSVKVIAHNMGLRHASRAPKAMREDYRLFRTSKRLSADEARRVLGIERMAQG